MSIKPVAKTTQAPGLTEINEKTSFFAIGLTICKYNSKCTEKDEESACYSHIGIGNLIATGNKVSILTVSHLFTDVAEEYFLMKGKEPMFPFRHAVSQEEQNVAQAIIPVGEIDAQTGELIVKIKSIFEGNAHFHLRVR